MVSDQRYAQWSWNVYLLFIYLLADAFDYLDAPVERITGFDVPMPYAINLEKMALPQRENIYNAVKRVVHRKI